MGFGVGPPLLDFGQHELVLQDHEKSPFLNLHGEMHRFEARTTRMGTEITLASVRDGQINLLGSREGQNGGEKLIIFIQHARKKSGK